MNLEKLFFVERNLLKIYNYDNNVIFLLLCFKYVRNYDVNYIALNLFVRNLLKQWSCSLELVAYATPELRLCHAIIFNLYFFAIANIIRLYKCISLGVDMMEFMTAKEAAEKWGITPRRVQVLCAEGRINCAWRLGNAWAIPVNSEKPRDERTLYKNSLDKRGEND